MNLILQNMRKSIEIVFIEYRESNLPRCTSPIRQIKPPQVYLISVEENLLDSLCDNPELYEFMYLTEGIFARQYGHLRPHNVPKMCKLHFLQKIKLCQKPIVVFTTLDIIDSLGPEFTSKSDDGLIREISCISYLHEDFGFEKYYVTFNNKNCSVGTLNSFTHERIGVLSTTALICN